MNKLNRLKILQITTCLGFLLGIIFSHELWFSISRTFPRVPMLIEAPILIEQFLTIILVISLIFLAVSFRPKIFFISAITSLILLVFFDQMRLQPWVYQYFLLLTVLAFEKKDESNQTLGLAQIIIAGLYFWSGLQKLNFTFLHETLPSLFENIFPTFLFLGIAFAVIESLIGCGLIFRKTRNLAVCSAILMHAAVLVLLIAKNHNSIVWIWNIALIFMVFVVFWKSDFSIKQTFQKPKDWKIFVVAASVLLPILSFFGLWDMYLSGALYSGNVEVAVMRIDDELNEKLPPKARQSVFQTKNNSEKILPLSEWAINELNVPAYPERRVSEKIALEICRLTDNKNRIELIIKERPAILDGSYKITRITCAELEKP